MQKGALLPKKKRKQKRRSWRSLGKSEDAQNGKKTRHLWLLVTVAFSITGLSNMFKTQIRCRSSEVNLIYGESHYIICKNAAFLSN